VRRLAPLLAIGLVVASCNGSTGNQLISFSAYAQGAPGLSQPFTTSGYSIQLTEAKMHIGAVYVDEAPLGNQAGGPVCIAPDIFAAQVPGPIDVDLLTGQSQQFSVFGQGTLDTGSSWQLWLTDGDINEVNHAHIVDLQGVATRLSDGTAVSFASVVTINDNRLVTTVDPSQPGANPICKRRIVLIGGIDTTFFDGGTLTVTVDPRQWFNRPLDFASLPAVDSDSCLTGDTDVPIDPSTDYGAATVCIPNTDYASGAGATDGKNFFASILAGGPYSLSFQ
jgi:hypothetical protein